MSGAPSGTYTISAKVYVTSDYNGGTTHLLHSRWWNGGTVLGTTVGGFPTERDQWVTKSGTFSATSAPTDFSVYLGYPQGNSAGYIYLDDISVTSAAGTQYITNGGLDNGAAPNESGSYGTYVIMIPPPDVGPSS